MCFFRDIPASYITRAGATISAATLRARGCNIICLINRKKQRGDEKRSGALVKTSEHDGNLCTPNNLRSPPRSTRFVHLRRTRTCSADRLFPVVKVIQAEFRI
jgi:hypothetical protein